MLPLCTATQRLAQTGRPSRQRPLQPPRASGGRDWGSGWTAAGKGRPQPDQPKPPADAKPDPPKAAANPSSPPPPPPPPPAQPQQPAAAAESISAQVRGMMRDMIDRVASEPEPLKAAFAAQAAGASPDINPAEVLDAVGAFLGALNDPSERARRVDAAAEAADALAAPLPTPTAAAALYLTTGFLVFCRANGSCVAAAMMMAEAAFLLQAAGLAPGGPVELSYEYLWLKPIIPLTELPPGTPSAAFGHAAAHTAIKVAGGRWDAGFAVNSVFNSLAGFPQLLPEAFERLPSPEITLSATAEEAGGLIAGGWQVRPAPAAADGGGGGRSDWVLALRPVQPFPVDSVAQWLGRPLTQADVDAFWQGAGEGTGGDGGPTSIRRRFVDTVRSVIAQAVAAKA